MPRGSCSMPGQGGRASKERQAAVLEFLRSRPGEALTLDDVYDRLKRIAHRQLLDSAIGSLVRRGEAEVVFGAKPGSRMKSTYRAAPQDARRVG